MNGLVMVFAGSRLVIAPEIHADEPGVRPASNDLPFLPCHEAPPGTNQAQFAHGAWGRSGFIGFQWGVIDQGNSRAGACQERQVGVGKDFGREL